MGPDQIIKNRINLDLIKIIQFCLKIYDLLRHPHLSVGGWVDGLFNMGQLVGSGHITKIQINLELIEIIQFFLKISDLLRHSHLWMAVGVVGWISGLMDGSMGGSMGWSSSNH